MKNVKKSGKSKKPVAKKSGKRSAPRLKLNRQSKVNVPEMASLTCSRSMDPINSGSLFALNDVRLSSFPRAVSVATAYQRYRISGITITVKPNMDAFTSVAAGAAQKPYLYYVIDKGGNIPLNITLEGLKQLGCRPHRLDEKPFTITYRPGVQYGVLDLGVGSQYQQYKTSPWLSTNANAPGAAALPWTPSVISHLGIKLFVEQVGMLTTFNVDLSVQFQFIKPSDITLGDTPAIPMTLATINTSRDGIAGTADDAPTVIQ